MTHWVSLSHVNEHFCGNPPIRGLAIPGDAFGVNWSSLVSKDFLHLKASLPRLPLVAIDWVMITHWSFQSERWECSLTVIPTDVRGSWYRGRRGIWLWNCVCFILLQSGILILFCCIHWTSVWDATFSVVMLFPSPSCACGGLCLCVFHSVI